MAIRRILSFYYILFGSLTGLSNTTNETVGLILSLLMLIGIAKIAPLFRGMKDSHNALKESRTKYKIVADNTFGWEFWLDPDDHFIYCSPSCKRITLYGPDEFFKDYKLFRRIIYKDDQELFRKHRDESEARNASDEIEFRIIRADGELRWIGHSCQPVFDADGNYLGTRGSNRDITERKNAEQQSKELINLKSSFVSTVSHEFRTPLASISLSSEILQTYYKTLSQSEITSHFNSISNSVGYLTSLLEEVIMLNRIDMGKLEIRAEDLDIIKYIRQLIQEIKLTSKNSPVINFFSNVESAIIKTDEICLRQIFANIISNAIKFTSVDKNVFINIKLGNQNLEIEIIDEGIGIPEEDQKEIFSPFFRAKNVRNIPGTGLGLCIAKRSVEMLNGEILLKSKLGKGTTIIVLFPVT
jgi:PAS domain S-box-containing protein